MLISKTKSINCTYCMSTINSGCGDPFNSTGLITITNQTYCEVCFYFKFYFLFYFYLEKCKCNWYNCT